ncbi:MAG: DinB family protein, partial [Candidatus Tectomicrobia bacterium]|nr:DinB family protein [Candidatus Tectomicrobia bacterium]
MDLQEHLKMLEKNRGELLRSIEGLSEKQLTEEPVEGVWSIKAVLDHIAAWDKEVLVGAGEIAAGKRPSLMEIEDFDACNARFVEERRQRSIQQTLEELSSARQAFIQGLKGLPAGVWKDETLQYLV